MRIGTLGVLVVLATVAASAAQEKVTKETVPGVEHFARVETTVACGGVITPSAIAELKQRGYKAVFNLQLRDEKNANVAGEAEAAHEAGLAYIHVPFTPTSPDTASVDTFLDEVVKPQNQPAFIHCGGGNRAAGFWMLKRVLVDHWTVDRAQTEAEALGLSSSPMKQFVLDYIAAHQRAERLWTTPTSRGLRASSPSLGRVERGRLEPLSRPAPSSPAATASSRCSGAAAWARSTAPTTSRSTSRSR